jgi:hypothetical protein
MLSPLAKVALTLPVIFNYFAVDAIWLRVIGFNFIALSYIDSIIPKGKIMHRFVAAAYTLLFLPIQALATTIVDTGSGKLYGGWGLGGASVQNLSSEFNLTQDFVINSIEGWMDLTINQKGHIAIYTDAGEIPGTELYSTAFFPNNYLASWQGVYGLEWVLATGTYWVAFESRQGDSLNARMGYPSIKPLGNEAVSNIYTSNTYKPWDSLDIGVRINGEFAAPIPEPNAAILMVVGLIGLRFMRNIKSTRIVVENH